MVDGDVTVVLWRHILVSFSMGEIYLSMIYN